MRLQEEENRREALQAQHASGPAQPAGYQYPHQQQQQWARNQGHHPQQPPQSAEAGGQRRRGERREKEDKSVSLYLKMKNWREWNSILLAVWVPV